MCHYVPYVSMW